MPTRCAVIAFLALGRGVSARSDAAPKLICAPGLLLVLLLLLFCRAWGAAPARADVPAAPANLAATAGNSQVALSWTASPSGYTVRRSAAAGGPYTVIATPTDVTYTDTGLRNGSSYSYVVTALADTGESPNSAEVTATPQAQPTSPADLVATAGDARVLLVWSASARADDYEVSRSRNGAPWETAATVTATTTYTDTGLTNGVLYSYLVRARNSTGSSADSAHVSLTPAVLSTLAPGSPHFGAVTATSIEVIAPSLPFRATSMKLLRGSGSYGSSVGLEVATGPAGAHTVVSGLTPNSYYSFHYAAVGSGGDTNGWDAGTSTLPPAPAAPEAPLFGDSTDSAVDVYAPPVPEWGQSLTLQKKTATDPDTSDSDYASRLGSGTFTAVSGLSRNTGYSFR